MAIKTSPVDIYREYSEGVDYNQRIELYDTVEQNENMFVGKCWEGVNAPDLDKPVIPLLKRVVAQSVAMIVSDDISDQITARQPDQEQAIAILQTEIDSVIEDEKMKTKNRLLLRNAAVDGDCCLYARFDPIASTGQEAQGRIVAQVIDNTNVLFGNRHTREVEVQPYILLPLRELIDDVKREAQNNHRPQEEIDAITPDSDTNEYGHTNAQGDLVTTIVKLWRNWDTGTIWATKTTQRAVVLEPRDTELRLYPVAYMSWDETKNSYHGVSCTAGLIPNQIFINKMYALAMRHLTNTSFPLLAYDMTRLPGGFSSKPAQQIGVNGNPNEIITNPIRMPEMNNQALVLIDKVLEHTQNLTGTPDVLLGNVRPENTSAIVALTKASAMPLEIQRLNFYQFVEDYLRIFIEIIATNYGTRMALVTAPDGTQAPGTFDFSTLRDIDFKLNLDVGQTAYWSEMMQSQTNDNMWQNGVITNPVDYLENVPNGYIRNKNKLIAHVEQQQQAAAQAQQMQAQMDAQAQQAANPHGLTPQELQAAQKDPELQAALQGG